jgi:hypothetical protein
MGMIKEQKNMFHKLTFKEEDHTRIKILKPFVKQIVSDMKSHVENLNPL